MPNGERATYYREGCKVFERLSCSRNRAVYRWDYGQNNDCKNSAPRDCASHSCVVINQPIHYACSTLSVGSAQGTVCIVSSALPHWLVICRTLSARLSL